nr:hypothetical protein GCM10020092_038490 [Actinoplanes digitatis]
MISAEVISAPSQCETSMIPWLYHAGEEVLVAAGHADHLVRQHRPDHQGDVVLDHRAVEQHLDVAAHPAAGQLLDPRCRDRTQIRERGGVPPLVVAHLDAGIGADVRRQGLGAHRAVRAERDQHSQPRHPAVQRPVHGADKQRQRAHPGGVRHEHAHAATVGVEAGEPLRDEVGDLTGGEHPVRAPDPDRLDGGCHRLNILSHRRAACRDFTVGHSPAVRTSSCAGLRS